MSRLEEAERYIKEARKAVTKPTFALFWKPDFEAAAQAFERAAGAYKAGARPDLAVATYMDCADCWARADSNFMAAKSAEQAAKLCETTDPSKASSFYERASEYYVLNSTPDRAAEVLEKAAKSAEDGKDLNRAVKLYAESITLFEQEERQRLAIDVIKRAVAFCVRANVQDKAVEFLEKQVATYHHLNNSNGTSKALLSLIIYLLHMGDEVRAASVFERGAHQNQWARDEMQAASAILDAYTAGDEDALAAAGKSQVVGFLDNHIVRIARQLKPSIIPGGGMGGGEGGGTAGVPAAIPGFAAAPSAAPPQPSPMGGSGLPPAQAENAFRASDLESTPLVPSLAPEPVSIPGLARDTPQPIAANPPAPAPMDFGAPPSAPAAVPPVPIPGFGAAPSPAPAPVPGGQQFHSGEPEEEGFC